MGCHVTRRRVLAGSDVLRQEGDLASAASVAPVHVSEDRLARRAPRLGGEIFHAREGTPMSEAARRVVHMTVGELLDFERQWGRHTGAKENAIRDDLGLAPARYYVLLGRAARSIEGQAHDPMTARRVRARLRA